MNIRNLVLGGAALFLAVRCFGDALPNSYLGYAVHISSNQSEPMGSGFLLQASNSVYLVTARHVLFYNESTNGWQLMHSTIKVEGFPLSLTNETSFGFELDLEKLNSYDNVRCSNEHDIALIRFESCDPDNKVIVRTLPGVMVTNWMPALSPIFDSALITNMTTADVGEDVFLFGFPSSIGLAQLPQIDQTRPLLRKGIIAGLNDSKDTIIIDCPVYQGNSGGPVVVKQQSSINSWTFKVIGIAVEWIPFQDVWESKRFKYFNSTLSNSGYSVVERCDNILAMVWE